MFASVTRLSIKVSSQTTVSDVDPVVFRRMRIQNNRFGSGSELSEEIQYD
jgi:hypothetical protein